MKFSLNQQDLQKSLNYCQGVIEKRSTLPILSNVLLDASSSKLTITATDLDLIFIHQISNVEILEEGNDILILAYGSMVASSIETSKLLKEKNINACIVNARFVKPLDKNLIMPLASRIQKVVTMEEGTLIGGFGSAIVELFNDNEINIPVYRIGIPDVLVDHASPDQSKEKLGLMPDQMADKIIEKFKLNN